MARRDLVIDSKGRLLIPRDIREEIGLRQGALVQVLRSRDKIIVQPSRRKRAKSVRDLFGMKFQRTGTPEWATPEEIKAIWKDMG